MPFLLPQVGTSNMRRTHLSTTLPTSPPRTGSQSLPKITVASINQNILGKSSICVFFLP